MVEGTMSGPRPDQHDGEASSIKSLKRLERSGPCGGRILARRTLGIILLLTVIVLWTTSNFLTSEIFADDSYSKPFLLTYVNVSIFNFALIPLFIRTVQAKGLAYIKHESLEYCRSKFRSYRKYPMLKERNGEETAALMSPQEGPMGIEDRQSDVPTNDEPLTVRQLADISLEFCLIFFVSNYLVSACLEYTSVGSATILTSTSSIFTLIFAALWDVEVFKIKNLIGVLASFSGVVLISLVDFSVKDNDENRGSFPHKNSTEIAIGNVMALGSAIVYGLYAVIIKKRVGNESRVDMLTVFGFMGLFTILLIWPGFFILHILWFERFQLPPTQTVWIIVVANSVVSFVSDFCWAYSMLLTSPTIATVGLSLSIPLSLVVQMVLNDQYSSWLYWMGASTVIASFLFINNENRDEDMARRGRD